MQEAWVRAYFAEPDIMEEPHLDGGHIRDLQEWLDAALPLGRGFKAPQPPEEKPSLEVFACLRVLARCVGEVRIARRLRAYVANAAAVQVLRTPDPVSRVTQLEGVIPSLATDGRHVFVHFLDYLELPSRAPPEMQFRYRVPVQGHVVLNDDQLHALAMQHLMRFHYEPVARTPRWVLSRLEPQLRHVRKFAAKEARREAELKNVGLHAEAYPPCVRVWMQRLQTHDKLSHEERWNLVAFLGFFGMSSERVIDLFRSGPKFNLEKTRYQVEFTLGLHRDREEDGDYHGYRTASCDQLRSNGICPSQSCDGHNPIQKYASNVRLQPRGAP